jgi:hypothetical protein
VQTPREPPPIWNQQAPHQTLFHPTNQRLPLFATCRAAMAPLQGTCSAQWGQMHFLEAKIHVAPTSNRSCFKCILQGEYGLGGPVGRAGVGCVMCFAGCIRRVPPGLSSSPWACGQCAPHVLSTANLFMVAVLFPVSCAQ